MTSEQEQEKQPTVNEQLARIMRELPPIPKSQRNKEQGYSFRGIDDVLIELNPLLAAHDVVIIPRVHQRIAEERITRSGTHMHTVHLCVDFGFMGPAGDQLVARTWGEGTDAGDKATNKAMTAAFKYALFQVFAIADASADADRESPEESVPVASQERHEHLADSINAAKEKGLIPERELGALGRQYGRSRWPLTEELMAQAEKDVAAIIAEGEAGPEVPGTIPGEPAVDAVARQERGKSAPKPGEEPFAPVPGETEGYKDLWRTPPFDQYTVPQLRDEARKRSVEDDGNKPDLVARLDIHQAEHLGDMAAQSEVLRQRREAAQ